MRDGAQVLVDRLQLMVGHALIGRPWHYLEQRTELGMRMVKIEASSHGRFELRERETRWQPIRFRGDIARRERPEGLSTG